MSSLMHPVGPHDSTTYWKRRAAVLLALLVPAILLGLALRSVLGGGSSDAAGPAPAVTTTTSDSVSASTPACAASAVSVIGSTDRSSYSAGSRAQLDLRTMNTSKSSCSLDMGAKAVQLTVYAGNTKVWSSTDCPSDGSSRISDLRPGASLHATVTWDLTSTPAECGKAGTAVAPGDYTLVTQAGQAKGTAKAFRVTK